MSFRLIPSPSSSFPFPHLGPQKTECIGRMAHQALVPAWLQERGAGQERCGPALSHSAKEMALGWTSVALLQHTSEGRWAMNPLIYPLLGTAAKLPANDYPTPTIPENAGSFGPTAPKGKTANGETKQPSQSHPGRQEMAETQHSLFLFVCLQAGNTSHSARLCVLYSGSVDGCGCRLGVLAHFTAQSSHSFAHLKVQPLAPDCQSLHSGCIPSRGTL